MLIWLGVIVAALLVLPLVALLLGASVIVWLVGIHYALRGDR